MGKSTEVKIWEGACRGDGCWTTPLYEAEECALATPTPKWWLLSFLTWRGLVLSSALHLAELVVGSSGVNAGPEAKDVSVVAFLSSWVRISAKTRAHIQYINVLANDKAHACT